MRRRTTPIGVDAGEARITAAQLRRARHGWGLLAAASVTRAPGSGPLTPEEAGRLGGALWRCGFRGREVILGVPGEDLLVSTMELPPRSSGAPLGELALVELSRVHRVDQGALEVAMWDLPRPARGGGGTHVMAVGCAHSRATAVLDTFERAGLTPRALDARLLALARACTPALGPEINAAALVELTESHALMAAVRDGVVVYQRLVTEAGLRRLLETLCTRLGVAPDVAGHAMWTVGLGCDPAERAEAMDLMEEARSLIGAHVEALTAEVRAVIDYALHLYPDAGVRRVALAGAGAAIPGLPAKLEHGLGAGVRPVAPADVVRCPPHLADLGRDPALTVAVGLAMGGGEV